MLKLDAYESAFFSRELEHIKTKTYDVLYASLNARKWIPISRETPDWATTVTYYQYDSRGAAAWITNYADDLPRCDVAARKFTVPVEAFGDSYGWDIFEIKASKALGKRLDRRKADAAAMAYAQFENRIAWFGKGTLADAGITGLLYNSNITVGNAPTGTWSGATPDQIIADINYVINHVKSLTKNVEKPDTCLMGIDAYTLIATTRVTDTNMTILKFVQENHPGVTFEGIPELDDVNPKPSAPTVSASTNIVIAYTKDPSKLSLEVPLDFTQDAPEKRNLSYLVNCYGKTGGVLVYYPLAVNIIEGI